MIAQLTPQERIYLIRKLYRSVGSTTELTENLKNISDRYGKDVLNDLINSPYPSEGEDQLSFRYLGYSNILEYSILFNSEAEKILIAYGAQLSTTNVGRIGNVMAHVILEGMQKKRGPAFNPTCLSDNSDYEQEIIHDYFSRVLDSIKNSPDKTMTINKTFIINNPYHWTSCLIQMRRNEQGDPVANIFFLDSTGDDQFSSQDVQNMLCEELKSVFGDIKIFKSKSKIQRDGVSCMIMTLVFARMFYSVTHGKFKQVQDSSYDFFKSLEELPQTKSKLPNGLDCLEFTILPAKFEQLSQSAYLNDYPKEHQARNVNSKNVSLSAVLESDTNKKMGDRIHNLRTANYFRKLMHAVANGFKGLSYEEKEQSMEGALAKFSIEALKQEQSASSNQQTFHKKNNF